jgi:8-oxo-dGTP pyrophosphatase MutT (NUDIX family)
LNFKTENYADQHVFTPEEVSSRALERLFEHHTLAPEDIQHSDVAIAGMKPDRATLVSAKPAAVLIPLIAHPNGVTMLLTQRSSQLRQHSGQIAFPGGKIDQSDDSPLAAALREAEEEIGLNPRHISPLGFLGPYFSTTGFRITPVVALVEPNVPLALNQQEVAEAFEIPLSFLMNTDNHRIEEREWKGEVRRYFAMPHEDRYIWGVTAGIIRMLWLRLYAARNI